MEVPFHHVEFILALALPPGLFEYAERVGVEQKGSAVVSGCVGNCVS